MMEERHTQLRLLPMGRYSKGLILPRWWLKINGDPEVVNVITSLSRIQLEPATEASGISAMQPESRRSRE